MFRWLVMAYHLSISRRSRYTQDLVLFCMTLSVGAEYHEGLIIFWKVRKSTNMGKFKNPLRNRNVIFVIVITTFTGLQLTVGLAWNNITHHRYVTCLQKPLRGNTPGIKTHFPNLPKWLSQVTSPGGLLFPRFPLGLGQVTSKLAWRLTNILFKY